MLAVVVVAGALAVTSWQAGWFGRGSGATHAAISPRLVDEVPSSLPPGGVKVDGEVLRPWSHTPNGAMSASEAIKAARRFTDRRPYPGRALAADLTEPGTFQCFGANCKPHAVAHVPIWLVTFTYPKPTDVGVAAPVYAQHQSVALNPVTGKFVRGFYER